MSGFSDPRFSAAQSSATFGKISKTKHQGNDLLKGEANSRSIENAYGDKRFSLASIESKLDKKTGKVKQDKQGRKVKNQTSISKSSDTHFDNKPQTKNIDIESRLDYLNKLVRGELDEVNASDLDDSSSEESVEEIVESGNNNSVALIEDDDEIEVEAPSTRRLSVLNCDWDNLKAVDIMVILQSFCPNSESVKSVTIFPSDFGIAQMALEERFGPKNIFHNEKSDSNKNDKIFDKILPIDENSKSDGEFIREEGAIGVLMYDELVRRGKAKTADQNDIPIASTSKIEEGINEIALREYERNKLKYYFAIAVFDSVETAEIIYQQLDGIEFEQSSMIFDLRFVPDDISFECRDIRDFCTTNEVTSTYQPPDFIIKALQHTNIECTWEKGEASRERKLTNFSAWKHLDDSDLRQYLASSDEESNQGDNGDVRINNLRKLLGDDEELDEGEVLQSRIRDDFFTYDDHDESDTDTNVESLSYIPDLGKQFLEKKTAKLKEETVFEEAQRKREEKRQQRKLKKKNMTAPISDSLSDPIPASIEQLSELVRGHSDTDDYDMRDVVRTEKLKKKKTKNQEMKEDSFLIDVQDQRFHKLFDSDNSHHFGIDLTSSEFKLTPGMQKILEKQRNRREYEESNVTSRTTNDEVDVNLLVKNIKRKFN